MNQTQKKLNDFLQIDIEAEFGSALASALVDFVGLEKTEAYRDAFKKGFNAGKNAINPASLLGKASAKKRDTSSEAMRELAKKRWSK